MAATARIAAAAQIDSSYSLGGNNVHPDVIHGSLGSHHVCLDAQVYLSDTVGYSLDNSVIFVLKR